MVRRRPSRRVLGARGRSRCAPARSATCPTRTLPSRSYSHPVWRQICNNWGVAPACVQCAPGGRGTTNAWRVGCSPGVFSLSTLDKQNRSIREVTRRAAKSIVKLAIGTQPRCCSASPECLACELNYHIDQSDHCRNGYYANQPLNLCQSGFRHILFRS